MHCPPLPELCSRAQSPHGRARAVSTDMDEADLSVVSNDETISVDSVGKQVQEFGDTGFVHIECTVLSLSESGRNENHLLRQGREKSKSSVQGLWEEARKAMEEWKAQNTGVNIVTGSEAHGMKTGGFPRCLSKDPVLLKSHWGFRWERASRW